MYDEPSFCDDTIFCNDFTCDIRRGALFPEEKSSTYSKSRDISDAGGASQETVLQGSEAGIKKPVSTRLGGTDDLMLDDADTFHDILACPPTGL